MPFQIRATNNTNNIYPVTNLENKSYIDSVAACLSMIETTKTLQEFQNKPKILGHASFCLEDSNLYVCDGNEWVPMSDGPNSDSTTNLGEVESVIDMPDISTLNRFSCYEIICTEEHAGYTFEDGKWIFHNKIYDSKKSNFECPVMEGVKTNAEDWETTKAVLVKRGFDASRLDNKEYLDQIKLALTLSKRV